MIQETKFSKYLSNFINFKEEKKVLGSYTLDEPIDYFIKGNKKLKELYSKDENCELSL
jgi:hypothetical protein